MYDGVETDGMAGATAAAAAIKAPADNSKYVTSVDATGRRPAVITVTVHAATTGCRCAGTLTFTPDAGLRGDAAVPTGNAGRRSTGAAERGPSSRRWPSTRPAGSVPPLHSEFCCCLTLHLASQIDARSARASVFASRGGGRSPADRVMSLCSADAISQIGLLGMSRAPAMGRGQLHPPHLKGVRHEAVHPTGLHPDRADDRGCDHRHPGGGCLPAYRTTRSARS